MAKTIFNNLDNDIKSIIKSFLTCDTTQSNNTNDTNNKKIIK